MSSGSSPHGSSRSLWDLTAAELRDRTASAAPTPGGGSIASVAGALGVSLLVMAAEITLKGVPDAEPLASWLGEARALIGVLSAHADRDVEVFDAYMAAAALPRATEDEKASRKRALGDAALGAARAPLESAADMRRALELGVRLATVVKRSVASDVLAGSDLLHGALMAALRNVDVNLPSIPDETERAGLAKERDDVLSQARDRLGEIRRALAPDRSVF
jgi:formiminotetrahydrofolate cyclodeaminase